MNREDYIRNYVLDLYKKVITTTTDGKLISEKENRYNQYFFSYTGRSGLIYTFPQNIQYYRTGKWQGRSIKYDRDHAISKPNKQVKNLESVIYGYGYLYKCDTEVCIWIQDSDRELWLYLLAKRGLTYDPESIKKFCLKYKNKKYDDFIQILDKRYIRLDEWEPFKHLNIEHDGTVWHIPEVDQARDEFLKIKYPFINIERISDFNKSSKSKMNELRSILDKYNNISLDPFTFNYEDKVIEQQLVNKNQDIEYVINKLLIPGNKLEYINSELALELYNYEKENSLTSPEILISA